MSDLQWFDVEEALPPPGELVLALEIVSDTIFPVPMTIPEVGYIDLGRQWYSRHGREIEVQMWTHIPPGQGDRTKIFLMSVLVNA